MQVLRHVSCCQVDVATLRRYVTSGLAQALRYVSEVAAGAASRQVWHTYSGTSLALAEVPHQEVGVCQKMAKSLCYVRCRRPSFSLTL